MKFTIKKKHSWLYWVQILLFLLLCEKIYNPSYISGKYNAVVTVMFVISSIILILTQKCRLNTNDMIPLMLIGGMVLYGFCRESIRYGMTFFSLLVWNKIQIKNLDIFSRALVITGLGFSLLDIKRGDERISGFFSGSATIYSCALVVIFLYFMFKKERTKQDYLFAVLCFAMALKTKSSSTLLLFLALIIYKIFINIFYRFGWKSWLTKAVIICSVIVVAVLLINNLDSALSIIGRKNRIASTSTRIDIYQAFWKMMIDSPKSFLLGYGGGFSQKYIRAYWGATSHLPLHQDILMFACEYGVIGLFLIYRYLIKSYRLNFLLIITLTLATFHNIILSPMTLLLIVMTSNALNLQYNNTKELWR